MEAVASPGGGIEIRGGENAGLAHMVASLLEPGLAGEPKTAARIRGSVAMKVSDRDAGVTISFEPGRVAIDGDADPEASVVIEAPLLVLGALGSGGHALKELLNREVKLRRGLKHPLLLWQVRKLLLAASA